MLPPIHNFLFLLSRDTNSQRDGDVKKPTSALDLQAQDGFVPKKRARESKTFFGHPDSSKITFAEFFEEDVHPLPSHHSLLLTSHTQLASLRKQIICDPHKYHKREHCEP
jgi:hypothetical protein